MLRWRGWIAAMGGLYTERMRTLLPVAFLFTMLPAGLASAQGLLPVEARALELKSQGRYRQARDLFLELLSGNTDSEDPRVAALAEYYATMASLLNARVGHDGATRQALLAVRSSPLARGNPILADRLDLQLQTLDLAEGRLSSALERTRNLGFLSEWWLVGPFPNERGTGFSRRFGPETEIDLDAAYEGSERQVRWHPLPIGTRPDGAVNLDAMVRPNDQVLCYAITSVDSDRSRD